MTRAPGKKRWWVAVVMASKEAWAGPISWAPEIGETAGQASATRRTLRMRSLHLAVGGFLVALLVLAALLAPLLAPVAPDEVRPALQFLPPGRNSLFGTDSFGRDVFSQVVWGARLALELAGLSTLIALLPGVALGLLAGYRGGWLDSALSRLMDAWLALPGMLLAILLVARLGPSLQTTILALGVTGVPSFYRLARSGAITIRQAAYVEAARSLGAGSGRILLRHILPNTASSIVVLASLRMGTALLAGSGLSFIGLGAQPPAPEWGSLLAAGKEYMDSAWWLAVFPGLSITATVMGFNLLGDGLRDALARDLVS